MATQLQPYLFFYGRCAEALEFYKSVFGGSYEMMRVGDAPGSGRRPPRTTTRSCTRRSRPVRSSSSASDGRDVKAVDPDAGNISLALAFDDGARGERIFGALSGGGNVQMPVSPGFWGGRFGSVVDKFGIGMARDAAVSERITPFLWFDDKAEEAARFYVSVFSIFPDTRIGNVSRYAENTPGEAGTVMTVEFELGGLAFVALNGGPVYTFTPAISFQIDCADQAEVDHFWDRLTDGGTPSRCGWLHDKFGVSWQVVPRALPRLLKDENDAKSEAVMQAMLGMAKIDVAALQSAYDTA